MKEEEQGKQFDPARDWHTQEFVATPRVGDDEPVNVIQELYDFGLIWLVNRTLHPFGYALGVIVKEIHGDNRVVALTLQRTDDPQGITFDEDLDLRGRRKFYRALKDHFSGWLGW